MEISNLLDRVQCSSHRNADWTPEKNGWTDWELQQRDRKYKIVPIGAEE